MSSHEVQLRPATWRDCHQVWRWNNADDVRAVSEDPRPILLQDHELWFRARLRESDYHMWIASAGGAALGVVRIDDREGDHGLLSITVDPAARGRGVGRKILGLACSQFFGRTSGRALQARIAQKNQASARCFEHCGFALLESTAQGGQHFRTYRTRRQIGMNTAQLDIWTSDFGARYTDRNDCEQPARRRAWASMLHGIQTSSMLEVGCNVGWNLTYLDDLGRGGLAGIEPQEDAVRRAQQRLPQCDIRQGSAFALPFDDNAFDLVFTSGVLIHIHANDLRAAMDEIHRVSRRYVQYIEYDANDEIAVAYRGVDNALWKRNHAFAWQEAHPDLVPIRHGQWGAQHGYDECGWCLFEKGDRQ